MRSSLTQSPVKYIAEFRPSSSPRVVALETAVYKSPRNFPSYLLSSGSHTITSNMLGILPSSTGPADNPWNLWMVLAYASDNGMYVREQQLLLHPNFDAGIGMN